MTCPCAPFGSVRGCAVTHPARIMVINRVIDGRTESFTTEIIHFIAGSRSDAKAAAFLIARSWPPLAAFGLCTAVVSKCNDTADHLSSPQHTEASHAGNAITKLEWCGETVIGNPLTVLSRRVRCRCRCALTFLVAEWPSRGWPACVGHDTVVVPGLVPNFPASAEVRRLPAQGRP